MKTQDDRFEEVYRKILAREAVGTEPPGGPARPASGTASTAARAMPPQPSARASVLETEARPDLASRSSAVLTETVPPFAWPETSAPRPQGEASGIDDEQALERVTPAEEVEAFSMPEELRVLNGTRVAEEYRALRTNVRTLKDTQGVQVLGVTSCHHAEGKTTTVVNLALFLAKNEKNRVLLLDGDLRRPNVAKFLGLNPKVGFEDVLDSKLEPESAMVRSEADNLVVIPARRGSSRASELLESATFGATIERMRRFFDFILVDTPPLLSTTDPAIIGARIDGMALLVQAGATQRESVNYARNLLEQARVNVIGLVLCKVKDYLPRSRYLYRYHYYRDYHDYYQSYGAPQEGPRKVS